MIRRLRGRGFASDLPVARFDPATDKLSGRTRGGTPGRTAATAAALMIGLALVTFIAVLANGMKASNRGAIEDQVKAQYVLTAQDGFAPFPGAGDALANSPEARSLRTSAQGIGKVPGSCSR